MFVVFNNASCAVGAGQKACICALREKNARGVLQRSWCSLVMVPPTQEAMDYFHRPKNKIFIARAVRGMVPAEKGSYMMKRFQKYLIVCRLLGCLFIEGIFDRSLKKARVRMISFYTLYSASCMLLNIALVAFLISNSFLICDITESFTKSLLFILNSVVITRIILNFGCVMLGSSRLLEFLQDSQAYEASTSFLLSGDSEARWSRRRTQARKFASIVTLLGSYGLVISVSIATLVQGEEMWWRLCIAIGDIFGAFVMLFCDCIVYVVLSYCSEVLVDYMRTQGAVFRRKDSRTLPCLQAPEDIEKVRLNVSTIKSLKRSINEMWYAALAVWAACVILILCITLYAVAAGDFGHPDVWLPMVYSVHVLISFADLAILSQALRDEAQKLREATVHVHMSEIDEACREQVKYLHDTIDPESMCITGAGFFSLNKALLVSMAGSIITYTVILVQTEDELAEHVDVGSLVRTHA